MGGGNRKYYKRGIYIPKDHVVDASKVKAKEKEGKEEKKKPMSEFLKELGVKG